MAPGRLDWRWLLAAAAAVCVCALSIVVALNYADGHTLHEVFNGLAWLSVIAAAFCAVRAGFDAGVHSSRRRDEVASR